MAHEKLFGICENKCMVEVPSLEKHNQDISDLENKHNQDISDLNADLTSKHNLDIDDIIRKIVLNVTGNEPLTSCEDLYKSQTNITTIDYIETHFVTDMTNMFYKCTSLTSIPQLDTNNVTDMTRMFYNCTSLTSIPQLDTSNVTNMACMFGGCSSLTSIPDLDTSNVTIVSDVTGDMFKDCTKLTTFTDNPYAPEGNRWQFKVDIRFSFCPLDRKSILKVFNGLQTVEGKTITISSTTNSYLSDEDKAIATNKGWTITVV